MTLARAQKAQQMIDEGVEDGVDAEEEEGKRHRHDQHHDRGRDRLFAGRPDDLCGFSADLTDEFAGGNFRHVSELLLKLRIEKGSAGTWPAELSLI